LLEKVKWIKINDDWYYPVVLNNLNIEERGKSFFGRAHSVINKESNLVMKVPKLIFVKKWFNKLSHEEDPLGIKMFSSKPFSYLP